MPRGIRNKKEKGTQKQSASNRSSVKRPPALHEPAREEIERRAYEIYLARGGTHGYDQEDWLEAERQLRAATSKSKSTAG